jgi:hypothetical protein
VVRNIRTNIIDPDRLEARRYYEANPDASYREVIGNLLDDVVGRRAEVRLSKRLATRLGHLPATPAHHQFFSRWHTSERQ